MSRKNFFRQMASNAYDRETKQLEGKIEKIKGARDECTEELAELFRLKVTKNPACNICGVIMNIDKLFPRDKVGKESGDLQKTHYYLHATNASPDCIKASVHGHRYTSENVQMVRKYRFSQVKPSLIALFSFAAVASWPSPGSHRTKQSRSYINSVAIARQARSSPSASRSKSAS